MDSLENKPKENSLQQAAWQTITGNTTHYYNKNSINKTTDVVPTYYER